MSLQNTYIMDPENVKEMHRLFAQGEIFNRAAGGAFPPGIKTTLLHSILDIGCGPGGWIHLVARNHPQMACQGIDISERMVLFARAQAKALHLQNAHFERMSALFLAPKSETPSLSALPDASFDLINARFIVAFMTRDHWPQLLQQCERLLRAGGTICLTECDAGCYVNAPALSDWYKNIFMESFVRTQRIFGERLSGGITPMFPTLLREAGFINVRTHAFLLDFSAGEQAHQVIVDDLLTGISLALPFLLKALKISRRKAEQQIARLTEELHSPDFKAMWYPCTFIAQKPV